VETVNQRIDGLVQSYNEVRLMQKVFALPHEDFRVGGRRILCQGHAMYKDLACHVYLLSDLVIITRDLRAGEMAALVAEDPRQKGKTERILQRITLNNSCAGVLDAAYFATSSSDTNQLYSVSSGVDSGGVSFIQLVSPVQGRHTLQFHDDEEAREWATSFDHALAEAGKIIRQRKNEQAAERRKQQLPPDHDTQYDQAYGPNPQGKSKLLTSAINSGVEKRLRRSTDLERQGVVRVYDKLPAPLRTTEAHEMPFKTSTHAVQGTFLRLEPRYMYRVDQEGMVIDAYSYTHIEKIQISDEDIKICFAEYVTGFNEQRVWTATNEANQGLDMRSLVDTLLRRAASFAFASIKVEEV